MESARERVEEIQLNLEKGRQSEHNGDHKAAYELYTRAHDASLDCPRLHKETHQHLWKLNWKLGNYVELSTDLFVLLLAPVGIFEMIAYFSKSSVMVSELCKR